VERLVIPLRVPPLTVDHGSLLVVAVAYLPPRGEGLLQHKRSFHGLSTGSGAHRLILGSRRHAKHARVHDKCLSYIVTRVKPGRFFVTFLPRGP
jgi:hypothetical protein